MGVWATNLVHLREVGWPRYLYESRSALLGSNLSQEVMRFP